MKMFNKITIVGVGLIGGAIGLAVKRKKLAREVIGVSRREISRRNALKFKAVDKSTLNMAEGVKDADLVIVAAPVGKIVPLALKCAGFMKKGAILTEVGSAKERAVREIEKRLPQGINFVGSHPMAGSDRQGVHNASHGIFNNAALILTKTKKTDAKSITRLKKFWKALGCRVLTLSPERHDSLVSLSSYLPHAVSFALSFSQTKNSLKLSGGSLRDTTRVSLSDAELWSDIFLAASEPLLKSIKLFQKNLNTLKKAVIKNDKKTLVRFLGNAKKISEKLPRDSSRYE